MKIRKPLNIEYMCCLQVSLEAFLKREMKAVWLLAEFNYYQKKKKRKNICIFVFAAISLPQRFSSYRKKTSSRKMQPKEQKDIRRHLTATDAPLLKSKRITKQRTVQTQDEQHCCGLRRMRTLAPVCVRRTISVLRLPGIALPPASLAPAFAQRSKHETRCTPLDPSRAQRGMLRRLGFLRR